MYEPENESDEILDFYRHNAAGSNFNLFAERGTGQRGATSTNNHQTYRGVRQILDEDDAHQLVQNDAWRDGSFYNDQSDRDRDSSEHQLDDRTLQEECERFVMPQNQMNLGMPR